MKRKACVLAMMLIAPLALSAQDASVPADAAATNTASTAEAAPPPGIPSDKDIQAPAPESVESTAGQESPTGETTESTVLTAQATGETEEFTPLPITAPAEGTPDGTNTANLITIALDNVELIDVVRMFSRIANANIIATPTNLTARVTANLDGVEWRPALSSILSMYNLALIERPQGSGVYSITPQAADAPEPMLVETIFLDYTTVDEVLPVIEKMLFTGGSVSTFASRNAMVIRSTESNLSEMRIVVKNIDIQSQQVCIETQFMELNDSAIKQIGIRWDSLEQLGVGLQAGPFVSQQSKERVTSRTDALKRTDSRASSDPLSASYDMYGNQFQAQTVSITERPDGSFIESYSIEPTREIKKSVDLTQDASLDIADTFTRTITESSAAILNVDSLNVVLSALKKTDGVSIVSNPKVIVANGTTNAFFRVGQREPIIKRTIKRGTQDSPGDEVTANLDTSTTTDYIRDGYLHTGIELRVVPTVKVDHLIEAQIEPSLRRKTGDKEVDGNTWPIISVKEIKTKFTLKSGQTVAIGGLTDTTDGKRTSKIPLLGDIPILGKYLFSHTRDEKSQVETIIFVSLTLVEPQDLTDDEGIPQRAELVHKERIKSDLRKQESDQEIKELQKAAKELEAKRQRANPAAAK
jgi:type II secretory pathway component GspD/PulD (secretin)